MASAKILAEAYSFVQKDLTICKRTQEALNAFHYAAFKEDEQEEKQEQSKSKLPAVHPSQFFLKLQAENVKVYTTLFKFVLDLEKAEGERRRESADFTKAEKQSIFERILEEFPEFLYEARKSFSNSGNE